MQLNEAIKLRLKKIMEDWRKKVGAQMMTANPAYDPARANNGPGKNGKEE